MKKRRGADIDDVDVVHAQHFVECGGAPGDTELVGDSGQTAGVDIAESDHAKLVGVAGISLSDVRAADATPGDGDVPDPSLLHGTGPPPPCACCTVELFQLSSNDVGFNPDAALL